MVLDSEGKGEMEERGSPGWATSGPLPFAFALRWEVLVAVPYVETALEQRQDGGTGAVEV
jgi:hypothetical protein